MDNDNYITINEQGLAEINPTASSDMQNAFIDAYRNIQGENTAQIGEQAHALGSDLEAQHGGLHGPSEYMKSRYQTPQTESRIAGLRTASQLSALNQLMQKDIDSWKDKYTQAYKAAQQRAAARAAAASKIPSTVNDPTNPDPNVNNNNTLVGTGERPLRSSGPDTTTIYNWSNDSEGRPNYDVYDNQTGAKIGGTDNKQVTYSRGTFRIPTAAGMVFGPLGSLGSLVSNLVGGF